MSFVYIIYSSKLDKYYIGACTDLQRRLYEHSIGHSKFTSTGVPWTLKHSEEFETLQAAKRVFAIDKFDGLRLTQRISAGQNVLE